MFSLTVNIGGHSESDILGTLDNVAKALVHKDRAALAKLEEGAMATYEMVRDFNSPRGKERKK